MKNAAKVCRSLTGMPKMFPSLLIAENPSPQFGGCLSLILFATVTAYFINGSLNSYTYHNPTVITVNLPQEDLTA